VLGVTTRDGRNRIVEQAEERSLHIDHDLCQKARSELTNPRLRLSAEMAWMPGVSPRMAEKLVMSLLDDPISARSERELPELARANFMAAAIELISANESAPSVADYIHTFARVVEHIDSEDVLRDINEDRAISGFPEVRGVEVIDEELSARRKSYRNALKQLLDSMDPGKLVETMTDAVVMATDNGHEQGPTLIHELVDTYELETQGFLQKEYENIGALVESVKDAAPRGERAVAPIIDKLDKIARNWDRVAQPIQLSARSRGIDHKHSRDVAYELRELGIELHNEYGMLDQAHRMTEILQELFAELPEVAERLGEDAEVIAGLRNQERERIENKEKWERDITYQAEIGMVFKDTLSISSKGVYWKGRGYPLESISRVRWGGVRHSINGIPSGTNYTIAFGDNKSEQVVQLSKESIYIGFIEAFWRAVCARLMFYMVEALEKGQSFSFGDMKVKDGAVILVKHKFLGSEQILLGWHDVQVWSADGNFSIGSKNDKKIYGSSSYISDWNTHLIEQIIRSGFKKGVSKLSDTFK